MMLMSFAFQEYFLIPRPFTNQEVRVMVIKQLAGEIAHFPPIVSNMNEEICPTDIFQIP